MENQPAYSYQEVYTDSLAYFGGDELAARSWVNNYALKDSNDRIFEKTPADMHWRIAHEVARIEAKYPGALPARQVFELFDRFRYLVPSGSVMAAVGNRRQALPLSGCFVIGPEEDDDTYGAVMKTDEEQVQLMKRGGAVGHDLGVLAPADAPADGETAGRPTLMPSAGRYLRSARDMWSAAHRGALALSLSVQHLCAEELTEAGMLEEAQANSRVCLKLDDAFMQAVADDRPYVQQYPLRVVCPDVLRETPARSLWHKLVHRVWQGAPVDLFFWNTTLRESLSDCYDDLGFRTVSVSPCSGQPLGLYDSCPLLSLNLSSYVVNPFTDKARFDFDTFAAHVGLAQRVMDDMVDLELENIDRVIEAVEAAPQSDDVKHAEYRLWEKVKHKCAQSRRTGLGITAVDDMMAALGLVPDAPETVDFMVGLQKTLALNAYRSSVTLAGERGAFPVYDSRREVDNPFVVRLRDADPQLAADMVRHGRRNMACLAVAPSDSALFLPRLPYRKAPGASANPLAKVRLMGAVQQWVDQSVAVTVTLPADAAESQLEQLYLAAWQSGCKNCFVVREGQQPGALASTIKKERKKHQEAPAHAAAPAMQMPAVQEVRPKELDCDVVRFQNNRDKWVAFVGLLNGHPYEIFTGLQDDEEGIVLPKTVTKGKIIKQTNDDGTHRYDFQFENKRGYKTTVEGLSEKFNPEYWNYAKLISGVLRYRMPIEHVIKLVGSLQLNDESINTWKNGVERALKKYVTDGTKAAGRKCPVCGQETLVYQDGSLVCTHCGAGR